ncbi:uncharacterized protein VICG_00082 [Vittaforma corneae ATCC 50505]|uniref:Uncharacterized protein n=1 Tax=Vittaforma corneae (strain ATCC 50505) TaxID=993615 RepID=L2GR20_VITCO|nr:uncharacterized protein VICG_00082 [Vittaforma corneae ATCC 50505]ELA42767.1 hypothetical protein VICG_00082 [Vittaforma corneae ATCC 50505]
MIFKTLQKTLETLQQNKRKAKIALLLLLPASLLFRPDKYNLYSKESLFDHLEFSRDHGFYSHPKEYEEMPPHQTIYICFEGSRALENRLNEKIKKIMVRSKSIQLSRENINESFFVKIYLKESKRKTIELHPFRTFQPNSDLISLAKTFFTPCLEFSISDILFSGPKDMLFENRIDLCIDNSEQSIQDLCYLLRYYLNMHSHYYGIYYYIPLANCMITFDSLKNFMIGYLIYELFDFSPSFDPTVFLIRSIAYYFFPISGLLALGKDSRAAYLFVFAILNFKFGFLYCVCLYLNALKTLIKALRNK